LGDDAAGGQGVPEAEEPEEVEGEEPEFDDPEFDDPEVDPSFAVEPVVPVPGKSPQGEPLGVVPGVVEVFGFTVDGCVLLPVDGGFVEFAPGMVDGDFEPFVPVGGVEVVPVGGAVVELVGGAAVEGCVAEPD